MKFYLVILMLVPFLGLSQTQSHSITGTLTTSPQLNYLINYRVAYQANDTLKRGVFFSGDGLLQYTAQPSEKSVLTRRDLITSIGGWRKLGKTSSLILFTEGEHSISRRVDFRLIGGLGYKRYLINKDQTSLELSQALTIEELRVININQSWTLRSSSRLRFKLGKTTWLTTTVYLQPPIFSNTGASLAQNLTGRAEMQLKKSISGDLSFIFLCNFNYQAYQAWLDPRIKPYDLTLQLGLILAKNK